MWARLLGLSASSLAGCSAGEGPAGPAAPIEGDEPPPDCAGSAYPDGVVEPMALGGVLAPYRWPTAVDRRDGRQIPLDLGLVPCNVDPNLDWSPFDVLLFVSIPAW